MAKQLPADRLDYSGDLRVIIDRVCDVFGVGKPTSFSIIEVGYEDCNVVIETSSGKYVTKIFSKKRSLEDITRYSTIMEKAVEAHVHHPRLLKTNNGDVVWGDKESNLSLVLMEFVQGKSFLELDRVPTDIERRDVLEQARRVSTIQYHPPYLLDSWAIPNIVPMFARVSRFIEPKDLELLKSAAVRYQEIPVDQLPQYFVHGDFTKANVIKGEDGKIYILDFSVSNWYPRIQELAVIIANLLHDENSSVTLHDRIDLVIGEYIGTSPLTSLEKKSLHPYSLAGIAMEFMGAHQEKYINGNDTPETEYWLNLGRNGLRQALKQASRL